MPSLLEYVIQSNSDLYFFYYTISFLTCKSKVPAKEGLSPNLSTVAHEFPQVVSYFNQLAEPDFARTGGQATETVVLDKGPLPDFGHSMEPQLRQMGMPVSLVRGVVTLLEDFTVCTEGATLTSEQARILKLLGHQQADFKLNLVGGWDKAGGEFTLLGEPPRASSLGEEEEEGSDME